jgi:hypothetical protein
VTKLTSIDEALADWLPSQGAISSPIGGHLTLYLMRMMEHLEANKRTDSEKPLCQVD